MSTEVINGEQLDELDSSELTALCGFWFTRLVSRGLSPPNARCVIAAKLREWAEKLEALNRPGRTAEEIAAMLANEGDHARSALLLQRIQQASHASHDDNPAPRFREDDK
jgi:hypothetical protein